MPGNGHVGSPCRCGRTVLPGCECGPPNGNGPQSGPDPGPCLYRSRVPAVYPPCTHRPDSAYRVQSGLGSGPLPVGPRNGRAIGWWQSRGGNASVDAAAGVYRYAHVYIYLRTCGAVADPLPDAVRDLRQPGGARGRVTTNCRWPGTRVAATFSTSGSPVEHWVRRTMPQPLFTIPEPFRPPRPVWRFVEGTPVRADGTPDPVRLAPHRFTVAGGSRRGRVLRG